MRELLTDCPSMVEIDEDTVLISHVYIERRMTPLNIYLMHATDAELDAAVLEYGNAIQELAAANIFPGDMLYKNFGVTRLDRVVFYDYDEIEYMTDCNFRRVPVARHDDDEMSSEVSYYVDKRDMFPERWGTFLLGDDRIRAAFLKHHAERCCRPSSGTSARARVVAGHLEDVFPYPPARRFSNRFKSASHLGHRRYIMNDSIVIASAARTPIGGLLGDFAGLQAWQLGATAIRAAVERAGVPGDAVEEVLMGCCLMAGQGQAPARQAVLAAGLPQSAGAVTLSKMCGSGMRAMMFAHDMLTAGSASVIVAGGMESMTNAPHLLVNARKGYRYGAVTTYDHMALDGLEDAYQRGKAMGVFAEDCVAKYCFTREEQDKFAIASTERALAANNDGSFAWEIAPVKVPGKGGEVEIGKDEQPFKAKLDKIPGLKPAFKKDGTITAANASSISDGAAALVLMRASTAEKMGVKPIARILAHSVHANAPEWFTTAPIGAIDKVLKKTGWKPAEVDLWEVNEAFAAVTMAAMRELNLPHEKVNMHGGACALGHPIGASGARIVVTLLGALRKTGGKRGVAALCIGGGEATAMALEVI
jgi:acetyl-CoA C-acetyltransferase